MVIFVDDINMPKYDSWGDQATSELLRFRIYFLGLPLPLPLPLTLTQPQTSTPTPTPYNLTLDHPFIKYIDN